MKRSIIIALSLVAVAGLVGCGDETGSDGYSQVVYEISSWTFNPGGCNVEGQPFEARPEMLYVKFSEAPRPQMEASVCADPADCNRQIRSLSSHPYAWTLRPDGDENSWQGNLLDHQELDAETCVGNQVKLNATTTEDGQIRIEIRHFSEVEFGRTSCEDPQNANDAEPEICLTGYCSTKDLRLVSQGQACEMYEVIVAKRIFEVANQAPVSQQSVSSASNSRDQK